MSGATGVVTAYGKSPRAPYVDEVWTDMRPRSLRERMDQVSP